MLDVRHQPAGIVDSTPRSICELANNWLHISRTICRQGYVIPLDVGQEPRRNGNCNIPSYTPMSQHRLRKGTASSAIAVTEGVDGLELSVSHSHRCKRRQR